MALSKHDPIWATTGHGGTTTKPSVPPPEADEVVLARERLRQAEAEYFAKVAELREAVARAEGRKQ